MRCLQVSWVLRKDASKSYTSRGKGWAMGLRPQRSDAAGDGTLEHHESVADQFSLFLAGDRDKSNHALAVFEDQARSPGVHDCGHQMPIGLGDAAMSRDLVIAGQF